jgi:Dihydrodipicolinate synthetase family
MVDSAAPTKGRKIVVLTSDIKGVIPIAPTPFHDDGRIDETSLDRMTDFFMGCGIDGITILGQLGEAPKLDHQESIAIANALSSAPACPSSSGCRLRASPRCAPSRVK